MKKFLCFAVMGIFVVGLLAGCGSQSAPKTEQAAKSWAPTKEIEFVVPSAPGGGSDLNARVISEYSQKMKLSPKSFMVVNKPGGSGAVSFSYVYSKKGDPHTWMVLHSGQVMSAIVNKSPVKADMLTYIAVVAFDDLLLGVNKDGKYKDIQSVIKAAKENPDTVKIGGSQRGNSDHLSFEMFNKYTGAKATYIQFNSSGEVMAALLGGHVDVGIFNPSECEGQVKAQKVIPIAAFSKQRISGSFKDTPTFTELGFKDIQLTEVRAIAGPPDMPAEAVKFYEDMLKKITETEDWKKNYIEKNAMTPAYMNAAETKKYFNEQSKLYENMFKEVGVIQ
jgi:putative tricarboxylic transport membrane protein